MQDMIQNVGTPHPEFLNESHKSVWRKITAACTEAVLPQHNDSAWFI
jgi:hypothetical protein